jgi:hypothetical protein
MTSGWASGSPTVPVCPFPLVTESSSEAPEESGSARSSPHANETATTAARRGQRPPCVLLLIVNGLRCGVTENTKMVPPVGRAFPERISFA